MTVPLLEVRGLTITTHPPRRRPTGERALVDDVGFAVAPGERVAVLGASGSGKSLTADAILGVLDPRLHRTGSVHFAGSDVTRRTPWERPGMASVPQAAAQALNPLETVGRQLALAAAGLPSDGDTARGLLRDLGLDEPERVLSSYPAQLSGGQRQRVMVALALLTRPRLLICDESTSALDTVSAADVVDALRAACGPRTALLFISHDLALAATLCERAVILAEGRVVADAPIPDLLAAPPHPWVESIVAAAQHRGVGIPA